MNIKLKKLQAYKRSIITLKQKKTLDTLKEANQFAKEKKKDGYEVNIHGYKVKQSYAGKNHTFYDVSYWK